MATEVTLGGDLTLFKGEDKEFRLSVTTAAGIPVDITGWAIQFVVRRTEVAAVVIDEAATITGVYNVDPDLNTQWAVVTLTDTDMSIASGIYKHSWKRTDDGSETILARGPFHVELATQT